MAIIPDHMFKNYRKSISSTVQPIPSLFQHNKTSAVEEKLLITSGTSYIFIIIIIVGIVAISGVLLIVLICVKYKPHREVGERSRRRGLIYQGFYDKLIQVDLFNF